MTAAHEHEHAPETQGKIIRWAHLYHLLFGRKLTAEHRSAIEAADLQPGEKVLDAGCGPGTMAIAMAAKTGDEGEVVGIDASMDMIGEARRTAAKESSTARFESAAIESLPFADGTFDAASSTFMLHHLPEDVQAKGLAEVRRVLKPGGRFVIVDFSSESHSFLGHLLSILGHAHGHSSFPGLKEKLEAAGFRTVERLPSSRKAAMVVRAK